jgi:hypothetical protein
MLVFEYMLRAKTIPSKSIVTTVSFSNIVETDEETLNPARRFQWLDEGYQLGWCSSWHPHRIDLLHGTQATQHQVSIYSFFPQVPADGPPRTYYQGTNFGILEKAWDGGWYTGNLSIPNAPPRCAIAVTNFNASSSGVSLRLYYAAANNLILEKGYDTGSWYDGSFKQACIPGSKVAAISWGGGGGVQIRVYFQNGTQDSAITEWCWNGGWVAGQSALPPA